MIVKKQSVWKNKEINWKQVEDESEDYQYFTQQQQEDEKLIVEHARNYGFIEGYKLAC